MRGGGREEGGGWVPEKGGGSVSYSAMTSASVVQEEWEWCLGYWPLLGVS